MFIINAIKLLISMIKDEMEFIKAVDEYVD